MTKTKPVVFVPLNAPPQGDKVNAPSKIEEPQYPDVGVSFAGYSKTPLSGNQFRLNPQTPFHDTYTNTAIAGVIEVQRGYPPAGKTLYISSLQLNTSVAAVDADTYVQIRARAPGGTARIVWANQLVRSETIQVNFSVPLKISENFDTNVSPSGYYLRINASGTTINALTISVQGWIE